MNANEIKTAAAKELSFKIRILKSSHGRIDIYPVNNVKHSGAMSFGRCVWTLEQAEAVYAFMKNHNLRTTTNTPAKFQTDGFNYVFQGK